MLKLALNLSYSSDVTWTLGYLKLFQVYKDEGIIRFKDSEIGYNLWHMKAANPSACT